MNFASQHFTLPPQAKRRTGAVASPHGFTLLELLVASTVTILLLALLLTATQGISSHFSRTQSTLTRQGDAAFALDQLVQDIEGYVVPSFPTGEALRVSPEIVGDATNSAWLTLLTTATDRDNSQPVPFTGATRAVSYRIARQNTIDGTRSDASQPYALYRAVASAKHTFVNITATTTNLQTQYWQVLPSGPAPAPSAPTDTSNFLSENVVALSLRFLRGDTQQWTRSGAEIRIGRDGTSVDGTNVPGGFQRAEVSITVLTPEGAARVKDGSISLAEGIRRFGQTSVRQTAFF